MNRQPHTLQQYQQNMRQPTEHAPQREQQATPQATQQVEAKHQSLLGRMGAAAKDALAQGVDNAKQYGQEVLTGQKLWEGLKQKDGALDGWLAHGATELSNMLLHGHPAPVYARSLSPAHQQAEVQQEGLDEGGSPQLETSPEQQAAVDATLAPQTSLEMYQRGMLAEQHQQRQQEMER